MKLTKSLFSNKVVKVEMEEIQKALVVAHSRYISQGKYEDALKISKHLVRNLDEHGNFNLEEKGPILKKGSFDRNKYTETELELSNQFPDDQFNEELELFFKKIGTYNLEKLE